MGLARERLNLGTCGLTPGVIATIQGARAASTNTLYGYKWRLFETWCSEQSPPVVSFQAPIGVVLDFLQGRLEAGLAYSTIKLYLAAISACHLGFDGKSVGVHPLMKRFMRGVNRATLTSTTLFPDWDLTVVLGALCRPPFEPLESVDLKTLSLKTVLLVALTTAKRVSDIGALSVAPECMKFRSDGGKVLLKPNVKFLPKTLRIVDTPTELAAFHPPPFETEEDRRLNCLCPVRALRLYRQKTQAVRSTNQLFISYDPRQKGSAVVRSSLSRWIVEAIALAYTSAGVPVPERLRAHSTRAVASSWALARGASVQEVCLAANWSSPTTFAVFYSLDVAASSMPHAVLGVAGSSTEGVVGQQEAAL